MGELGRGTEMVGRQPGHTLIGNVQRGHRNGTR